MNNFDLGGSSLGQLHEMAAWIDARPNWWRFPEEDRVKGFIGMGRLFIVGDQPSTSTWGPSNPNRRAFYDTLLSVGAADAHITDLYKQRGKSGSLKGQLPLDFSEHLQFFRKELSLLKPERVIALGGLAFDLLDRHVPEVRHILGKMWHFAYVGRYQKLQLYPNNMLNAFNGGSQWRHATVTAEIKAASGTTVRGWPEEKPMSNLNACMEIQALPPGVPVRRWTLRNDNNSHHHGSVRLSESPLYLDLSWRPTAADRPQPVGTFRLDLVALHGAGCIRSESPGCLRLRIVRTEDGCFYVQAKRDGPRELLVRRTAQRA
jgi:hypothetical protein